ncbi:uncharacterized protein LOC124259993 [Haliotis rubra]|uniref:uncharacterized protein LOC124259993 n=1 Tax=Haliotis rubra TaxID=36100 RepID=UPI001EE5F147|nr:uncharacterized protein LOC124259993 [Haliotis rubra]
MQTLLLFLSFVSLASCHDCVLQPLKIATRGRTYKTPVTELREGVHPVDKCGFVVVCTSSRAHVCRHKLDNSCSEIGKNCSILAQAGKNGPFRCVTKLPRSRIPSIPNIVGQLRRRKTLRPSASTSTKPEITGELPTDSWCAEEEETTGESKTSSTPTTEATTTTTEEVTLTTTKEATTVVNFEESTTTTEGWKLVREGTTSIPITTTTATTRPFGKEKRRLPFRFRHRS